MYGDESESAIEYKQKIKHLRKQKLKRDLLDQIITDSEKKKIQRKIEKEEDQRSAEVDRLSAVVTQKNRKSQEELLKERLARTWIEQSNDR